MTIYPEIIEKINASSEHQIPENRRKILDLISSWVIRKLEEDKTVATIFICTHNSRRSQFAQLWAQVIARYFNLDNIHCFSAGTESTALFPQVVKTLEKAGFLLKKISENENPVYQLSYDSSGDAILLFSKTIYEIPKQENGFMAIMVCSDAEENCPYIPEATLRIALPFKDPKQYDYSPIAADKYEQTSRSIATEMYYLFSTIKAVQDKS